MSFLNIWNNDAARAFFRENGYPEQYNDGLLAYLREVYPLEDGGKTLPDLLARYIREYGDTFNMIIAGKSAVNIALIEPAATFTNTTPTDGGGGTIVLTSAGAHGLTAANAVGASIYISAGTGWTVGFYPITAIDLDTTGVAITITGTFSVGLGTPTIALANTKVTLATITIPALEANSFINIDTTWSFSGGAPSKTLFVELAGTAFFQASNTTNRSLRNLTTIRNRGSTSSQVGGVSVGLVAGVGSSANPPPSGTVDTSVATSLTISTIPSNTANEVVKLESYLIQVFK